MCRGNTDRIFGHIHIESFSKRLKNFLKGMETDKRTADIKTQKENVPTSQRRCEINGKRFIITRHFAGDKDLTTLMTELAIRRADREMGL